MITTDITQRSLQWHRMRTGHFTGSKIADLMKAGRKKDEPFSDTAKAYIYQVAGERMFNPDFLNDDDVFQDYIDQTSFTTKAMTWGREQEQAAIDLFHTLNYPEAQILPVSSCTHDTIPYFSASPDGILKEIGSEQVMIIEVKCPNINTYIKYRTLIHDATTLKETEPKYYWQMMAEMSCTGATSGIFITYCPWLTKPLHTATVTRNDEDIHLMEQRVILANTLIEQIIKQ